MIGIIGGIMMLNTRTLARGNQFVFQGGHVPQRPVPPYAPQQPVTLLSLRYSNSPYATKSKCTDRNQTRSFCYFRTA
ncbi:MAG: hypothetical protein ACLSCV_08130 [Acutalibacteraceae bacterium]